VTLVGTPEPRKGGAVNDEVWGWMKVGPDACARANQDVRSGASQEPGVAIACLPRDPGRPAPTRNDLPGRLHDGDVLAIPEIVQARERADRVGVRGCRSVDPRTGARYARSARRTNHLTGESATSTGTHNRDCAHHSREERLRAHVLSPFSEQRLLLVLNATKAEAWRQPWADARSSRGIRYGSDHDFANPS
jgi:hypothetical protein